MGKESLVGQRSAIPYGKQPGEDYRTLACWVAESRCKSTCRGHTLAAVLCCAVLCCATPQYLPNLGTMYTGTMSTIAPHRRYTLTCPACTEAKGREETTHEGVKSGQFRLAAAVSFVSFGPRFGVTSALVAKMIFSQSDNDEMVREGGTNVLEFTHRGINNMVCHTHAHTHAQIHTCAYTDTQARTHAHTERERERERERAFTSQESNARVRHEQATNGMTIAQPIQADWLVQYEGVSPYTFRRSTRPHIRDTKALPERFL